MRNKATSNTDIVLIDDITSNIASVASKERTENLCQVFNSISQEECTKFLNTIAEIGKSKIDAIANTVSLYIKEKGISFADERPDHGHVGGDHPGLD